MDCWQLFDVICVEKRIELANAAFVVLGIIGLFSIYFAYRQLKLSQRAQQTQIAIQLRDDLLGDKESRKFFYRLDYAHGPQAWKFAPKTFPHSEEEDLLDTLLQKLSFIGSLVKNGDIKPKDLDWIASEVKIILKNPEVQKYLEWLKSPEEIPDHSSFAGAVNLYGELFGKSDDTYLRLSRYLESGQPARR